MHPLLGGSLFRRFSALFCVALVGLCAGVSPAEDTPQVGLDTNETLFTILAAINACGYDAELGASHVLRQQIRSEVAKAIEASPQTADFTRTMCEVYTNRQQADAGRTLAQYVSLALYLNPPPALTLKVKDAEVPPDAVPVIGIVPLLPKFYAGAGLHDIWLRHRDAYAALVDSYHAPLAKMLFDTEIYLKLPSAGYLGRGFNVYFDPMGAPGQTNARNYGSDYFVVISPGSATAPKVDQVRHTYLHYLVDPLALKYPAALKRLEPLLDTARTAPMDENFKNDVSLLVTECFIRAVEARTLGPHKTPEEQRLKAVQDSVAQGFILTRYFYEALARFEKDPVGLRNAYGDMLTRIDVGKENKIASQVQFAEKAEPELVRLSRPAENRLLVNAEQHLSSGDDQGAKKLAEQVLTQKSEDQGRALFILAQVAVKGSDLSGARDYFQRALDVATEPKVVAWSHIYLGRIFDLQEEREAAVGHYRAALTSGASLPGVKDAAERGLQQPYEPRRSQQ